MSANQNPIDNVMGELLRESDLEAALRRRVVREFTRQDSKRLFNPVLCWEQRAALGFFRYSPKGEKLRRSL